MKRLGIVTPHWTRWILAALLAAAAVPLFYLPVIRGADVIAWPTTLAADAALAVAVLLVMLDARRRTFGWMAALALPIGITAIVLHNVEYAIAGIEEPTFILIAIIGVPAMLLAGLLGLVWARVRDGRPTQSRGGPAAHAA